MVGLMGWGLTEQGWRKGPWTAEEDKLLSDYVTSHGEGRWSSVARSAGLKRTGKSCRLRWVNYLRPGLKRGQLTPQEESIIIELHAFWGNKWSTIARCLPGRTDNEIKNYWRTHFKKSSESPRKRIQTRQQQRQMKLQAQQQQQQQQQQLIQQSEQFQQQQQIQQSEQFQQQQQLIQKSEQFQQQQQLIQKSEQFQLQQQQQQQQLVDMKRIQVTLTEGDYKLLPQNQTQYKQDDQIDFFYPTLEDQCLPVMFEEGNSIGDTTMEEDSLWGGLWDMDDIFPTQFDHTYNNNNYKVALQSEIC